VIRSIQLETTMLNYHVFIKPHPIFGLFNFVKTVLFFE